MRFHKLEESIINGVALRGLASTKTDDQARAHLCKILKWSQKFYCGDLRKLPSLKDYAAYPLLPFHAVAFEYDSDQDMRSVCKSHFCIMYEGENSDQPDLTAFFFNLYPEGCAFIGNVTLNRATAVGDIRFATDTPPELFDEGRDLLTNHFLCIGDFLSILNCVNVKT